ncbi:MAG: hypothetical protein H0U53_02740 [Actinobacteria bacterium]|nr:hypothetical protein [Actinomycetota bacterium]
MTSSVLYLLLGAVAALTTGSAVALSSARRRLKADDGKPRTIATALGEFMLAWTGVGLAILVFYLLILLVTELRTLFGPG